MKTIKILLSTLSVATLAFTFSACDASKNATVSNAANTANKSNVATVVNSNQTPIKNTAPISNTTTVLNGNAAVNKTASAATPAGKPEGEKVEGKLQTGKTESVILYVGKESGDYAAYCFANDSEAGRAILAACKDEEQCEVVGKIDGEGACKVPGLEADLSASGKILKVESVKTLGRKK